MTAVGWLALATAVLLTAAPDALPARAGRLAASRRLAGRSAGGRAVARRLPVRCVGIAAGVGAVVGGWWQGGPALAVAAAAVAGCGWLAVRDAARRRASARRRADLALAVRVLVGELEAGGRPEGALASAAATAPSLHQVFDAAATEARGGGDAGAVLAQHPATRSLGLAWQLGHGTGTALGGVLGRVADDLSAAEDQRRTVRIALAGPRSSAAVLTGLPVLGLAMGAAMGARPLTFLVESAPGRLVCCAGVLLDVAGVLWVRRILHSAEPT